MRVAFDSRPSAKVGSMGRYSRCLLPALRGTAVGDAVIVESHSPRGADVYHSPWMQGAMLRSPCAMIVTLHDLAPLKRRSEYLRLSALPPLRHLAVQRAFNVIVPTRSVAADAIARLEIEAERITVIPAAPDPGLRPRSEKVVAAAKKRLGLPERYLVGIGCMRRPGSRRQLAKLAAIPRELPLVLVGHPSPWARELEGVILTGHVSDDDLAAIYSGADALVHPFLDDGFGLTAVEALACGTPVATFDTPALREALGGKASLVEPGDLEQLMRAAHEAHRPAPPPPAWTWEDAAKATWKVYEAARIAATDGSVSVGRIRGRARRVLR